MLPSPQTFLTKLFRHLDALDLTTNNLPLDHLCYRVTTPEEYRRLKDYLLRENTLLVESAINGRSIATFRLMDPFTYDGRIIDVLELPAPKPGSPYPTGYEHAEFVVPAPLEDWLEVLQSNDRIVADRIDLKGFHKSRNRDVRLSLPGGISVKFHEQPLATVIARELAEQGLTDS